jgi:predicted type IV restriction endonuclease
LENLISRIKERLGARQYENEAAVSRSIILPVLQALGWDISDPSCEAP